MSHNSSQDWRQENDKVFDSFARAAGFKVRGSWAWRVQEYAQNAIHISRSKTGIGEQSVNLFLRLERSGDRGSEVLRSHDIEATLGSLFMRNAYLESKDNFSLYMAATSFQPAPGGRGPALRHLLEAALPWFEAVGGEEALRRYVAAGKDRVHMGLVTRAFFEDYIWKTP